MDATRHGLFRRLRRRTSRAPLGPDPLVPARPAAFSSVPLPTVVQSPWLQAAFGLEVDGVSRALPLKAGEGVLAPAMAPLGYQGGAPIAIEEWPAVEHIVEPVWVWEPEQD